MVHGPAVLTSPENLLVNARYPTQTHTQSIRICTFLRSSLICRHIKVGETLLRRVSYQSHFLFMRSPLSICFVTSNFSSYAWAFLYLSDSPIFSFSTFRNYFYLRYGDDDDSDAELDQTTSIETQFFLPAEHLTNDRSLLWSCLESRMFVDSLSWCPNYIGNIE